MVGSASHWVIEVNRAVLGRNAELAEQNRRRLQAAGVVAVNIVSAPGSGKTALLERTLADLRGRVRLGVAVGDLQTDNDARRLSGRGAPVVQIVTGNCCHLEAGMVAQAADKFDLDQLDILIVENVGNLVCTAGYDLGEELRVVLLSVTEGEDKPLKYPATFRNADLVLITKLDLAAAAGANMTAIHANLRCVAPQAKVREVSARTGAGLQGWYDDLLACHQESKRTAGVAHA